MSLPKVILASLILLFNLLPCSHEEGDDCANEFHMSTEHQDSDEHSSDECSIFCCCSCCEVSVLYTLNWRLQEIPESIDRMRPSGLDNYLAGIIEIWQPPKI